MFYTGSSRATKTGTGGLLLCWFLLLLVFYAVVWTASRCARIIGRGVLGWSGFSFARICRVRNDYEDYSYGTSGMDYEEVLLVMVPHEKPFFMLPWLLLTR